MSTLPNAPRTGHQVTAWLETRMTEGYTFPEGECLRIMHLAAGLPDGHDYDPNDGHDPWAIQAFEHAHAAVHDADPAHCPKEVYQFYRSNSPNRPGHICWAPVAAGPNLTTDHPNGHLGRWDIRSIEKAWGMTYVGYAYDLNEFMVGTLPVDKPKEPVVKPTKPKSRGVNIDNAIKNLTRAEKANVHTAKLPHIKAALAELAKIPAR